MNDPCFVIWSLDSAGGRSYWNINREKMVKFGAGNTHQMYKKGEKSDSLQSDSCQYKQEDAMPVNNVTRRKIPLIIRSHSLSIIKKTPSIFLHPPKSRATVGSWWWAILVIFQRWFISSVLRPNYAQQPCVWGLLKEK